MKFCEAFEAMKQGALVKLPEWAGFWKWNGESIEMHCKDGKILDIRETEDVDYTLGNILRDEWEIVAGPNVPELNIQTFTFGEAIRRMKKGQRVARKGWNGKGQYIELAKNISYQNVAGCVINCDHKSIGNMAVAFVGTSGVQMGWLASQADMLAMDWYVVGENK